MKNIFKFLIVIISVFIFISCDYHCSNKRNYNIDTGILVYKTEYAGRFNEKSYILTVFYQNCIYNKYVEKSVFDQFNVKDSIGIIVFTKEQNNNIIYKDVVSVIPKY